MSPPINNANLVKNKTKTLSPEVQRYLGERLAAAYRQPDAKLSLDRFAELLARLDAALIKSQESDEQAFYSGLVEATTSLKNFAMSLIRNPAAADDLVQETMLRAWRSRSSFQAGTNLNAWLFTIMRNNFYSVHRKYTREVSDSDGDYAGRLASLPEQNGHLDLHDVKIALGRLSAPMREALLLVVVEDMSYENAARIMNCQIGTVKSRVWRARQQLATLLGYTGNDVGADRTTLAVMGMPGMMGEA